MSKQIKIAKEYLEFAKIDLIASNLLYQNNIYNLAIFALQQAVEKTTKCFVLIMEINNEPFFKISELKNHDSLKFLIDVIERYIGLVEQKYKGSDSFAINIKEGVKKILQEQQEKIKNINGIEDKEEITKQLNLLYNIQDFNVSNISKEEIALILKEKYNLALSEEELNNKYNVLKENIEKVSFLRLLNKVFLPLCFLGAITVRHESSTRYPFERVENEEPIIKIPLDKYNKRLGVIDTFSDTAALLQRVILGLEEEFK